MPTHRQDGNNFEATGVVEHRIELWVDHINNEPRMEPLRYDLDFEEAALAWISTEADSPNI
jgi:hypothetical protein